MTTLKQKENILNLISEIPNQQLQRLIDSGLLKDMLNANIDIIDRDKFRKIIGLSYTITVNYDLTVEEMVEEGRYDIANPAIYEETFKIKRHPEKKIIIELVHFNVPVNDSEVVQRLAERNLRPVTLPELLAFGAKYPKQQLDFPIAALGSEILCMIPGLSSYNETSDLDVKFRKIRVLCLFKPHEPWPTNCRFAAVTIENSSN
ncbi:MAG: hypothetical protein KAI72_05140 [Candidatus Pacebacteria bacterium]|nr:hypothetical protein [Candidatus Paceibacterota bacterium]